MAERCTNTKHIETLLEILFVVCLEGGSPRFKFGLLSVKESI